MTSTEQFTILIVDDDSLLLEGLASFFQAEGWAVFTADNIKKAFSILESEKIQVVLSDIRMPEAGGLELATNIRDMKSKQKKLALYFMTGYADHSDQILLSLGAQGIFKKPFDVAEAIGKITSALRPQTSP